MRFLLGGLMAAAFLCFAGPAGQVRADEEKVALDKVPKEVMEAVKKRFPKAEITGAEKETADGKTTYEINVKDKDAKIDVQVSEKGEIQAIEKMIDLKELPKVVAKAIDKKYPKATVKSAEEIIKVADGKEKLESYEVVLVVGKKTLEVVFAPDGKFTKEEDVTKEAKEDKKDK
jgi:hypothetical protein